MLVVEFVLDSLSQKKKPTKIYKNKNTWFLTCAERADSSWCSVLI